MQQFGRLYPHAGYGGHFRRWISSENPHPYGSWGNGSAMRASYAGWAANSLEEAEKLGEISAKVTHDHPEGIKGAVVVAGCIYKLRSGASKADVREYAGKYYDLNFTLDEIRPDYSFDVSCMGSVPQALNAFLRETTLLTSFRMPFQSEVTATQLLQLPAELPKQYTRFRSRSAANSSTSLMISSAEPLLMPLIFSFLKIILSNVLFVRTARKP